MVTEIDFGRALYTIDAVPKRSAVKAEAIEGNDVSDIIGIRLPFHTYALVSGFCDERNV